MKYGLRTRATGPELNLEIKLQGDFSNINNPPIKAAVTLYTVEAKIMEFTGQSLIQENQNVFSIKLSLSDIDLTKIYAVFIKPERYLGRLFCSQTVVGSECRSPQLIFENKQNNIDLSEHIFLSGDLKPFDGKVSSYDLSIIINNLSKVASPPADTDINNDDYTDTQDYSLALYTLGKNGVDDTINFASPSATPTPTVLITPTQSALTSTPTPTTTVQPTLTKTPTQTPTSGPSKTPAPTSATSACSDMDDGLPNSTMHYPDGSTSIPSTTKEICAFNGTQYYSLPYRNPNCSINQTMIDRAYERIKTYYPGYWGSTKILDDWEAVQTYAEKYNFNPLFVTALWIEESAAGGATAAQQLGCLYRLNSDDTYTFLPASSNICEQMECLFGRRSVDPSNYALWACQYQYGSGKWQGGQCLETTSFTKGIEYWYNYMGEDLSSNCQIKYYSPADSRCSQ